MKICVLTLRLKAIHGKTIIIAFWIKSLFGIKKICLLSIRLLVLFLLWLACDSVGVMKFRKATGPTKVVIQMLIASSGMDMKVTNLTNSIIRDGKVQKDPKVSHVINLYKGKGDALGRGNFTSLTLWACYESIRTCCRDAFFFIWIS